MTQTTRVFVDGIGLDVPSGSSARDAVALHSAPKGAQVDDGSVLITDSRGLPIPGDTPTHNGAVFRLIPNRSRDAADPAARFE